MTPEGAPIAPRAPSAALFLTLAVTIPVILLGLALFLSDEYSRAAYDRQSVQASADLNAAALAVRAAMRQAETAQRGYVLTHDARFLEPYEPARRAVAHELARYHRLASDGNVQSNANAKFAEMDEVLALGRQGRWDQAMSRISDGEGLALMEHIERSMQAQIDRSNRITATSRDRFVKRSAFVERAAWALILWATVVLLIGLFVLWRMRRDRWNASIKEHAAATRVRSILNSTSDAIVILDPRGTIEQANAATFRLLGYAPTALKRRDVSAILDIAPGDGAFHERIGANDVGRSSLLVDRAATASDGRVIPVDVALGWMGLPDGLHVVASIRDVSQRKTVERMKDDFVATVSHELRTPLTSVVGSLGLLRSGMAGALPELAHELVTIAENNTRRLIRLTNDILDLEKLGSGAMTFEFAELDLNLVAAEAADAYRASADLRGIRIRLDQPQAPLHVMGDHERLMQAVGNLLSNAIRHSPDGSTVTVTTRRADGRVVFSVTDQGDGVPPEFRERIFDRFGQGPSHQTTGTGLGLAIVREIVARHDASIWYEDAPGGGAVFSFTLAYVSPAPSDTLMLFSNDADTVERVAVITRAEGLLLETVETMEAVAEAAKSECRPALFLFDLDMAAAHREAFWGWLNGEPDLGGVPWAVVSHALIEHEAAWPLDILAWFPKPIDDESVRALIVEARERRRSEGGSVILHVEDDRDLATVMATALSDLGEVLTALDLASARELLRERTPDIVILDMALPDGSGVELMPDLIDREGRPIPVVVHSAQAVSDEVVARAALVVTKSRTALPDLRAIVRGIVEQSRETA